MSVLPACLCVHHVLPGAHRDPKSIPWRSEEGLDPLELELGVVKSCHVGSGNPGSLPG